MPPLHHHLGFQGAVPGLRLTHPPSCLVARGLFWEKAPHSAWALGQAALDDEVSEHGGEGELTQSPQRKPSSLSRPPHRGGEPQPALGSCDGSCEAAPSRNVSQARVFQRDIPCGGLEALT